MTSRHYVGEASRRFELERERQRKLDVFRSALPPIARAAERAADSLKKIKADAAIERREMFGRR